MLNAPAAVRLGSDLLLSSGRLRGARVGIVCNHASLDHGFAHIVDRLTADDGVRLAAIFGPQHGFRSDVQDNMIETPHRDDPSRRVPIYSLYSETREPTADMLKGLDLVVIDLQDIGARIYTYIYTMANCLRACGRHGVPVIVCDRPNPINGVDVEGNLLPLVHTRRRRVPLDLSGRVVADGETGPPQLPRVRPLLLVLNDDGIELLRGGRGAGGDQHPERHQQRN